jgi:acyl-homoserine-lactone acylase
MPTPPGTSASSTTASIPNRPEGVDWSGVLPGDRSDLIWQGYRPVEAIPQLWNPKSGYVYNSNNSPFLASDPADNLKPADFPASHGPADQHHQPRPAHAGDWSAPIHAITDEAFRRYKYDLVSEHSSRWR